MKPEIYIHDAPSLVWKIYMLVEEDKLIEAEHLLYQIFNAVRRESQNSVAQQSDETMKTRRVSKRKTLGKSTASRRG